MDNSEHWPLTVYRCTGCGTFIPVAPEAGGCCRGFEAEAIKVMPVNHQAGAVDPCRKALERIIAIGAEPRSSMHSKTHQLQERGQAMLDVANDALAATQPGAVGARVEP